MSSTLILLIIAAILILAGLAFYAGKLLFQLKQQKQAAEQKVNQRNQRLEESIRTISSAMKEEQCEISEGVLRLTVLLDHLSDAQQADYRQQYPSIHALNDKIKHLAILDERKQLAKKDRMRQDMERWQHEADFKELVLDEANRLTDFKAPVYKV
ncbi:DUF2489 domain-containing protein [Gayadomonas joobiniege]|uniref:DUF2489 domain-containing protein n=1 Tax=Gayadomonas joobiniege TaxID=1234606 RepID=UPI0003728A69|nr:DUF2489 domain-containing protein [Gayadomonas joobiniege]